MHHDSFSWHGQSGVRVLHWKNPKKEKEKGTSFPYPSEESSALQRAIQEGLRYRRSRLSQNRVEVISTLFYFFTNSAFSYLSSSPNFICTRQLFFKLAFTSIFLWLVDPLNFRSIILFCS